MTMTSRNRTSHPCAYDWSGWTRPVDKCCMCGVEVTKGTTIFDDDGTSTVYCHLHIPRAHLIGSVDSCKNVFDNFTLQHVKDESGKKVTVNSLKELRAAEKKYNFALAVASDDGGKADTPPQHEKWAGDIAHDYERKWQRDPAAYKSPSATEGVSAGPVSSAKDTLVSHPNPV